MNAVKVELDRHEILKICDATNTEANRFSNMAMNAQFQNNNGKTPPTPQQSIDIWQNASGELFAITRKLLSALKQEKLASYAPQEGRRRARPSPMPRHQNHQGDRR